MSIIFLLNLNARCPGRTQPLLRPDLGKPKAAESEVRAAGSCRSPAPQQKHTRTRTRIGVRTGRTSTHAPR